MATRQTAAQPLAWNTATARMAATVLAAKKHGRLGVTFVAVADAVDEHDEAGVRVLRAWPVVFTVGALIGVLGGLIGLGGAEFRLPLLISVFGFAALQAVIMNKAMSLIVVLTAYPTGCSGFATQQSRRIGRS